jgi:hypothetical protein
MTMPNATGRSMLIRLYFRSRQALSKNGPQLNISTGRVKTQDAQRKRAWASAVISPGSATYAGNAYIITCIMHRPATSQRQSAMR